MRFFVHRLTGFINQKSFDEFTKTIERVKREGSRGDTFVLYVCSKGGELYWAERIAREVGGLMFDGFDTLGVAYKEVHSAALIPYLACVYRISRGDPTFLFHKPRGRDGEVLTADQRKFFDFVSTRTFLGSKKLLALVGANEGKGTYLSERRAKLFGIVNLEYKTRGVRQVA